MRIFGFASGVLLVLLASSALAAEDSLMEDTIYLDTYTVTAEEDSLTQSNLRVEEKSRSNNIADYLSNDTEISYKRKSNIGDSGDVISIRGFESKRIMLNLDGRSISSTGIVGGNYVDFSTIPLDNIERIEIIKGGSSIEYGNNALGGVINAYTKEPTEEPSLDFYATTGGWEGLHDFHNIRGSFAQKYGHVGLSVGASHQQAEAYLRNNDYESVHVYPKLYIDTPWGGKLTVGYNFSYTDRGLIRTNRNDGNPVSDDDPGLAGWGAAIDDSYPTSSGETFAGGAPTPAMTVIGDGAHWIKRRHLYDATYRQEILDDGFMEVSFFKNYETRVEQNFADVAARSSIVAGPDPFNPALTKDGDLVLERNVTVDKSYGTKLKGGWEMENHYLRAGYEYKVLESGGIDVRYVDTNYNAAGPNGWTGTMEGNTGSSMAYVTGVFAGDKYQVTDDLLVDFGVRFDRFTYTPEEETEDHHQFSPKATVTYDIDEAQTVSFAAYQNYRTPTLPELYWNTQANSPSPTLHVPWMDNDWLKPESELGFDLAYRYRFENGARMQLSGFYYDIDDYIMHKSVSIPTGKGPTWAAFNADAIIKGLTVSASYPLTDSLTLQGAATLQKSEKKNDPSDPDNVLEKLDYIPDVKANLGLTWDIRDDLVLDVTANYIGERDYTINTSALKKGTLDDYTTVGASLRWQVDERTTLEFYGDNLTNENYEESWGYPAMGMNLGVSVKWKL